MATLFDIRNGDVVQLGRFDLQTLNGGQFRIDGGTMFGVVPRVLWERQFPADDQHRIAQRCSCLLVRSEDRIVVIDTGYGSKLPDKQQQQISAECGEPLVKSLAALGVTPDEVDAVIFTHLHFDHAGGASRTVEDGSIQDIFPRAEYIVQRREWVTAIGNFPEFRGAYQSENLEPLAQSGRLRLIDGNVEILPGLRAFVTGGHTDGHQAVLIESEGQVAVYLGDLCPTWRHLPVLWCLGYDVQMSQTRRAKAELLGLIADRNWFALFDHDPEVAGARLARDSRKDFVLVDPVPQI